MFVEISLILLGLLGLLVRRNLFAIALAFMLTFAGIACILTENKALDIAWLLSIVFGLQITLFGVLITFLWRHHGTLHMDEIKEYGN
ncbi:MAG: hypothetical protein I8H75_01100 [Myxococcaceae bacterium]|nr:hypothetical protein [Myxococcaceae bacterium]MBH2005938.1 hypothetical protein [Myxococcaceae bacterium]